MKKKAQRNATEPLSPLNKIQSIGGGGHQCPAAK
jgi:hypothetical protein